MFTVLLVATPEVAEPVMDTLNDQGHFPLLSPNLYEAETTIRSGSYPIDTVVLFEDFDTDRFDLETLKRFMNTVHELSQDVRIGLAGRGFPKGENTAKELHADFYNPRGDSDFIREQVNKGRVSPERRRQRGLVIDMPETGVGETGKHRWSLRIWPKRER